MNLPNGRSVWGVATDEFKTQQRRYLLSLLGKDDPDRDALINAREWCLDEWDSLRKRYFPDESCSRPLNFPFFESTKGVGTSVEAAKYCLIGSSGQPSVIDIRRNVLLGTGDIAIWSSEDKTRRLILSGDHEKRADYLRALIRHELLHQWLVESAPDNVREQYAKQSSRGVLEGGELKNYKGHGPLFASWANELNSQIDHTDGTITPAKLRIAKRSNASMGDRQLCPCSWFATLDLFFLWDPEAEGLTDKQLAENAAQMQRGLDLYGGAITLEVTPAPKAKCFEAIFSEDCFDICLSELRGYDTEHGTSLVLSFLQQAQGLTERDFPKSAREEKDNVQYADDAVHGIDGFVADIGLDDISAPGDKPGLDELYPISKPDESLMRLERDLAIAKKKGINKAQFSQHHGHPNGQKLSRHLKELRLEAQPVAA